MKRLDLTSVQLSIDGHTSEYENRKAYVDGTTFDTIVANIRRCLNNTSVALRLNIDEDNLENIIELVYFLSSNFNDKKLSAYPAFLFGDKVINSLENDKKRAAAIEVIMDALIETNLVNSKVKIKKSYRQILVWHRVSIRLRLIPMAICLDVSMM